MEDLGIVRAYSFRFDQIITRPQAQLALDSLDLGDGIVPHGIRGIFEDGHLLQLELHIYPPVTADRIELGRSRLENALRGTTAELPHQTGLEGSSPDALFQAELDKIKTPLLAPAGLGSPGQTLSDWLKSIGKYGLYAAGGALAIFLIVRFAPRKGA